jgi:hypothetical protein
MRSPGVLCGWGNRGGCQAHHLHCTPWIMIIIIICAAMILVKMQLAAEAAADHSVVVYRPRARPEAPALAVIHRVCTCAVPTGDRGASGCAVPAQRGLARGKCPLRSPGLHICCVTLMLAAQCAPESPVVPPPDAAPGEHRTPVLPRTGERRGTISTELEPNLSSDRAPVAAAGGALTAAAPAAGSPPHRSRHWATHNDVLAGITHPWHRGAGAPTPVWVGLLVVLTSPAPMSDAARFSRPAAWALLLLTLACSWSGGEHGPSPRRRSVAGAAAAGAAAACRAAPGRSHLQTHLAPATPAPHAPALSQPDAPTRACSTLGNHTHDLSHL